MRASLGGTSRGEVASFISELFEQLLKAKPNECGGCALGKWMIKTLSE